MILTFLVTSCCAWYLICVWVFKLCDLSVIPDRYAGDYSSTYGLKWHNKQQNRSWYITYLYCFSLYTRIKMMVAKTLNVEHDNFCLHCTVLYTMNMSKNSTGIKCNIGLDYNHDCVSLSTDCCSYVGMEININYTPKIVVSSQFYYLWFDYYIDFLKQSFITVCMALIAVTFIFKIKYNWTICWAPYACTWCTQIQSIIG